LNKTLFECCDICYRAKQTRSIFPLSDSKAERPFALIHCNLWGYYKTSPYTWDYLGDFMCGYTPTKWESWTEKLAYSCCLKMLPQVHGASCS